MCKKYVVVGMVGVAIASVFTSACFATGIGSIAPMAIIPEPATGLLLAIGGLMVLPRRRQR